MAFDSLFQATPKFDSPSLPRDYENTNQFQSKQRLFFSEKAGDKQKKKQSVLELRGGSATPATMTESCYSTTTAPTLFAT